MSLRLSLRIATSLALCVALIVGLAISTVWVVQHQQDSIAKQMKRNVYLSKVKILPKPFTFLEGGRQLFPNYRLVALYGSPDMPALGALGEQPVGAAITRAQQLAAQYQPLVSEHVMPTLEIIATIASATPTANNDYSQEVDSAKILPWVTAAQKAGVYVVLDLQSGRSNFLTQAEEYRSLLEHPNVGLALDPEWRLGPAQVPLAQIGTVNIDEVNQTAAWLANLTKQYKLPQKLLVLHQFRLGMIQNRTVLDTAHPELAYVIQMDGSGTQPAKLSTWQSVTANAPPNVRFGWKNFYHVDMPVLDPAGTMALVPKPWYVSYQ